MPVLNYTTTIAPSKTLGEMQQMLAKAGAERVTTVWDGFGHAVGLEFTLLTVHGPRQFTLPVDVEAMHKLLRRQFRPNTKQSSKEQAERVAWRVMKDWLAAQLALVETQMASIDQVMLPYLMVNPTKTMYVLYQENERKVIEA